MLIKRTFSLLYFTLLCFCCWGQDVAFNDASGTHFKKAYQLAYEGNHNSAKESLLEIVSKNPDNHKASALLGSTYSWSGQYNKARALFNNVVAKEQNNRDVWISSVKNELYAKNNATALGLANKALTYLTTDSEIERLREIAMANIENQTYAELNWSEVETNLKPKKSSVANKVAKTEKKDSTKKDQKAITEETKEVADTKKENEKKVLNNRISIRNSYTVFDQRYDPMAFSSIEYKRQTLAGSIIPRINYGNRNGVHGVQYDLDFYPKFSKRFYAYLNYGYSNASIYPNHKVGGDLYVNLPGAIEFSAGGRFVALDTRSVTVFTNSLGYYRGNYYFSLRSSLTPKSDNLNQFSGNLLIRKYLKDADNYLGFNIGMGYSPELRQLISGDELLAETLLYIESQRMSFQYQFTGKKNPNIYSASVGVSRQELAFESGSFIWAVSAGLAYQVRF